MRTPERPSTPDTTQTTAAQRWYDRGTTEPSFRICRTAKSPASAEAVRDTRCTSVPRSTFCMIVEVSSLFEQVFFRSTSRGGRPGSSMGRTSAPIAQCACLSTQCRARPRRYNVLWHIALASWSSLELVHDSGRTEAARRNTHGTTAGCAPLPMCDLDTPWRIASPYTAGFSRATRRPRTESVRWTR